MLQGPGAAFAITSIELLLGTFLLMIAGTAAWPAVSRGHWRATTWTLFPLVAAVALLLPADLRLPTLLVALSMLLYLISVYSQRPLLEWGAGSIAFVLSLWLMGLLGLGICSAFCVIGPAHLLIGALFLGSTTHAMALGHWYLNQPRLPIEPLLASTYLMLASIVPPLVMGLAGRPGLVDAIVPGAVLMISANAYWWTWLALLISLAPLGMMVRSTVKTRSTQSATGLLYISMVPALGAQFLLTLLFVS